MRPGALTSAELKQFHEDGFIVVRGAFPRDDALAMQDEWWSELSETHGIERDDRSTWRPIPGDLKRAKQSPLQHKIASARVCGVIDELMGPRAWRPPADWGRAIATFPEPGDWDVPSFLWHWDNPGRLHEGAITALFVIGFIGEVAPRAGGTLVLSGSHRLLQRQDAVLPPDQRESNGVARRELFHRSHPWLMALTGKAPSPADRVAVFMDAGTEIDGVLLRVIELTGEPGDMVFCHPTLMHCGAPNRGDQPRFMRIKQQLMSEEGRRLHRAAHSS